MPALVLESRVITGEDCFVVAEIGANHMGEASRCEVMIESAAVCGADAVKFQKRDNRLMFTEAAYNAPYDNDLSYGRTYGEHREYLDWFGKKEYDRFRAVADKHGILLFATPFEERSADFLYRQDMPLYKIASCDVNNHPLVKHVASFDKPMIISTGGAEFDEIAGLVEEIDKINNNYAILHCISTYPNEDAQLNLETIPFLAKEFGKIVGLSSHHPGLLPHYIARTLGANIFEAHFTLNRGSRGTDHGFSLEPQGLRTLCKDLKRIPGMRGEYGKFVLEEERAGFIKKMGKGIYLRQAYKAGQVIVERDLVMRSPAGGYQPYEMDKVVGQRTARAVSVDEPLAGDMLV